MAWWLVDTVPRGGGGVLSCLVFLILGKMQVMQELSAFLGGWVAELGRPSTFTNNF